jgi:hypothetical protein
MPPDMTNPAPYTGEVAWCMKYQVPSAPTTGWESSCIALRATRAREGLHDGVATPLSCRAGPCN